VAPARWKKGIPSWSGSVRSKPNSRVTVHREEDFEETALGMGKRGADDVHA
jgi:hypothetical protein